MFSITSAKIFSKRLLRRYACIEFLADCFFYLTSRLKGLDVRFCGLPFRHLEEKDLVIVFACGIGDAVYGLPMLKSLSERMRHSSKRFEAVVEKRLSKFANPAVKDVLEESGLFDSVVLGETIPTGYWKYFGFGDLTQRFSNYNILPYVYRLSTGRLPREQEVARQFGCPKDLLWPKIEWPEFPLKLQLPGRKLIVLHFETRSGNYFYPHLKELCKFLQCRFSGSSELQWVLFSTCPQPDVGISVIDPRSFSVGEQIGLLQDQVHAVVSINSYLWPITRMLNVPLYGIHYLANEEAVQLCAQGTPLLTTSKRVANYQNMSILLTPGQDCVLHDSCGQLVFSPNSICCFIEKFLK